MATNSAIGWCDHTANLWWGCVEVSPLCDNCYAREWAARYDRAKWGADEPRLAIKGVWNDLRKWQRDAAEKGIIYRVFCGSMMDIFEKPMPVVDAKGEALGITTGDLRQRLFDEVVPASPNLLLLFLTKRASNIVKCVPPEWLESPPPNVMYGTSVGTQSGMVEAMKLMEVPGRRFLSMEPLLEPVRLDQVERKERGRDFTEDYTFIDNILTGFRAHKQGGWTVPERPEQIITGIESRGSRAGRFADGYEAAARTISQQCAAAGVLYFNKQMLINGRVSHDPAEWPADLRIQQVPELAVPA